MTRPKSARLMVLAIAWMLAAVCRWALFGMSDEIGTAHGLTAGSAAAAAVVLWSGEPW